MASRFSLVVKINIGYNNINININITQYRSGSNETVIQILKLPFAIGLKFL